MKKNVCIILLNWNGWKDTVECLESIFRQEYNYYTVVVCDNDSQDDSIEHMTQWAQGKLAAPISLNESLLHLTNPPVNKPLEFVVLDREQAEQGTSRFISPLVFIQTGENLGFAGGCNVGLRYAMNCENFDYIWLLNNDTVIRPDTLSNMVDYSSKQGVPNTCGSRLVFYDQPETIQAFGGSTYNRWTGRCLCLGWGMSTTTSINAKEYERKMDYVTGASWLLPMSFLHDIGLMDESYFLYYEEIDWCLRAGKKYQCCYADNAIVYHKQGASIGSENKEHQSSLLSDFYMFRNQLRITKKFFPFAIPSVYMVLFLQAINRLRRGQWSKSWLIGEIILGKKTYL